MGKEVTKAIILDDIYTYALVKRAYDEKLAEPYSKEALRNWYSNRLLRIGSDHTKQDEVLSYIIVYDNLYIQGFDNFILYDHTGDVIYPSKREREHSILKIYHIQQPTSLFLDAITSYIWHTSTRNKESLHNEIEAIIRDLYEYINNSSYKSLTDPELIQLVLLRLRYLDEDKYIYDYDYTDINLNDIIECVRDEIIEDAKNLQYILESCCSKKIKVIQETFKTSLKVVDDLPTAIELAIKFSFIEDEIIRNIIFEEARKNARLMELIKRYNICKKIFRQYYTILNIFDNAKTLGVNHLKLFTIRNDFYRYYIGIEKLRHHINDIRREINKEGIDEEKVSTAIGIILNKVYWLKPRTYREALQLSEKENIMQFREWFWSNIDALLSEDERKEKVLRELERGVEEVEKTISSIKRLSRVSLYIELSLSAVSMLLTTLSPYISASISFLSLAPQIMISIKKQSITKRYAWLVPDIMLSNT